MQRIDDLFNVFSGNLTFYDKKYMGQFMCPLCMRTFTRKQVRDELSKAHIIPKSLGGRQWTLTCKGCNNKVGSQIESYEVERAKFNWALAGDGDEKIPAKLRISDDQDQLLGPISADMGITKHGDERHLRLDTKPKGSNTNAWEEFKKNSKRNIEVDFIVTNNKKRANLTYLHAAYLFMFHHFGYEWVLDRCSKLIREQIMSPDKDIISPLSPKIGDVSLLDDEMGILLVTEPKYCRYFLVVLPLIRGWRERYAVWMPLFGNEYSQPTQEKFNISYVPVPDLHSSLNRDKRNSLYQGFRFIRERL